jgi:hypothetical protein
MESFRFLAGPTISLTHTVTREMNIKHLDLQERAQRTIGAKPLNFTLILKKL